MRDHISIHPNPEDNTRFELVCHHCGVREPYQLPATVTEVLERGETFREDHDGCPSQQGAGTALLGQLEALSSDELSQLALKAESFIGAPELEDPEDEFSITYEDARSLIENPPPPTEGLRKALARSWLCENGSEGSE